MTAFHQNAKFRTGGLRPTSDIAKIRCIGISDPMTMQEQAPFRFFEQGAEHFPGAIADSLADLRAALVHLPSERAGIRISGIEALRPFLACNGAIGSIAANVLGPQSAVQ